MRAVHKAVVYEQISVSGLIWFSIIIGSRDLAGFVLL